MNNPVPTWLAQLFGAANRGEPPSFARVLQAHLQALVDGVSQRPAAAAGAKLRVVTGEQRVVVEAGLTRVEVFLEGTRLRAVVPTDAFFPGLLPLTGARKAVLADAQAALNPEASHFVVESGVEASELAALAGNLERCLREVLDVTPDVDSVSISTAQHVDNGSLIEQMRALAKSKDYEARRLVYQECVNAWFYVPVAARQDAADAEQVLAPHPWKADAAEVEWAVFTDEAALKEAHPAHEGALLVSGIRVLRAASHARIASLHINPTSRVGGQLLRNELKTIADYLRSLGL